MILLDTHVLYYHATNSPRLSKQSARAIANNDLAIADITLWEIAMLSARKRIQLNPNASVWLSNAIEQLGLTVLPIQPNIAKRAAELYFDGDPADKIIAATALEHRLDLVTADGVMHEFEPLTTVW